jgi:cobalamin biosynthesis Mg chelatase CobN
MDVFSSGGTAVGRIQSVHEEHLVVLGAEGGSFASGHYNLALVLIASIDGDNVCLTPNAEAALILQEAYEAAPTPRRDNMADTASSYGTSGTSSTNTGSDASSTMTSPQSTTGAGMTGVSTGSQSNAPTGQQSWRSGNKSYGYTPSSYDKDEGSGPSTALIIGSALVGALAGAALPFMLSGQSKPGGDRKRNRTDVYAGTDAWTASQARY